VARPPRGLSGINSHLSRGADSVIRIPGGRAAGGEARAVVTARLGAALDPDLLRDVHLLVSEVVNNSVMHGGVDEDGWIDLTLMATDERVRCEICDSGSDGDPEPRDPDFENGGGFGLYLVDAMAARWGTDRDTHLTVWFELDLAG
jgi:anti-sigma regulatory factor (Ser/Thr protein kinase)